MHIVDTIVSREGVNSAWANVVFLGDRGESVSVRLPWPVPSGGEIGRNRIIKRAASLLKTLVACESFETAGERAWPTGPARIGAPIERSQDLTPPAGDS